MGLRQWRRELGVWMRTGGGKKGWSGLERKLGVVDHGIRGGDEGDQYADHLRTNGGRYLVGVVAMNLAETRLIWKISSSVLQRSSPTAAAYIY
jgi:hypothetical protein